MSGYHTNIARRIAALEPWHCEVILRGGSVVFEVSHDGAGWRMTPWRDDENIQDLGAAIARLGDAAVWSAARDAVAFDSAEAARISRKVAAQ